MHNRDFLAGGGEMGARIRAFDWSSTPLGDPAQWPQSLKTTVRIMLDSRYAMWMAWGPELTFFCNDAYLPTVGIKRDWVLGARSEDVWQEVWFEAGPRIARVLEHGEATWDEALLLFLERSGFPEETYHTFSYSPLYDDASRVTGMLCVVTEVTERVIGERRLRVLRDLAAPDPSGDGERKSVAASCERACRVLAQYPADVSFAALYLFEAHDSAHCVARTGAQTEPALPSSLPLKVGNSPWPVAALLATETAQLLVDLPQHGIHSAAPPWPDAVQNALVLPLKGASGLAGFLIVGASPRRPLDDKYRDFLDLVAGQIGTALADAQAYEAERQRMQALAELDRTKTAFFSNVSHEFRTPLTLMLGPLEEMLAAADTAPALRPRLDLAHRNALRLLKLVNSLLDFSRVEAGREKVLYEPVDLAALTRDLASTFRSAIERAGLRFTVSCDRLATPVHVDRDMWEKIVLNLLSNALKFTLEGAIAVRLSARDGHALLEVEDTGIGIPAAELPRLFERFHRVDHGHGRTFEGSGIGLALAHELVQLHGGSIAVTSEPGRGSTFRVELPLGSAHLPADRIGVPQDATSAPRHARAYVEEALRWLPELDAPAPLPQPEPDRRFAATFGAHVLIADDNADMRTYLRELLGPHYDVETVADGRAALAAALAQRPDLILSDVMMPQLDGFGLLRELRASEELRDIPVILLSARAGEDARIRGLDAGADDYLAKPFFARELLARVGALLELTQMRRENEARLQLALSSIQDQFFVLDAEWRFTLVNPQVSKISGLSESELLGHSVFELFPEMLENTFAAELLAAAQTHQPRRFELFYPPRQAWLEHTVYPTGAGAAVLVTDITARKTAQQALQVRTEQFETLLNRAPLGVFLVDAQLRLREINPGARRAFEGIPDLIGRSLDEVLDIMWPPALAAQIAALFRRTLATGRAHHAPEHIEMRRDRDVIECYEWEIHRIPLPEGSLGVVCYFRDIAAQVRARGALLEQQQRLEIADRQKDKFLAMLAHELRNPLAPIHNVSALLTKLLPPQADAQAAIGMLRRQTAQLTRLVDDLLDVSRITEGRIRLKRSDIDIAQVISQALETVEPLLQEKQQRVRLCAEPAQPLRVHGDLARLVQCVGNVLANAAKYSDPGSEIRVDAQARNDIAEIVIADDGAGIAPDLLPQVFDLFVQSDRTLDRAQGGLGIGLSVVRQLMEMHGGSVTATSAGLGRGSTFTLRMPLAQSTHRPVIAPVARRVPPRRLFIVDDNVDAADSLAALLMLDGHRTQTAYTPQDALQTIGAFRPDIVLLDIGLPQMDGYELAAAIRQLPELAEVYLIALTGYGQSDDRERGFAAGFNDYLVKPVELPTLRKALQIGATVRTTDPDDGQESA